jgi:hypothetical protein
MKIPFQMYTSVSLNHDELYENLVTRFSNDPYMDVSEIDPDIIRSLRLRTPEHTLYYESLIDIKFLIA